MSPSTSSGLEVRELALTDIPSLAALLRRHARWIGEYKVAPPETGPDAVRGLTAQLARHQRGEQWSGVIVEGGVLRGQAAVIPMPGEEARMEVVVWVEPDAAGRGLGGFAAARLVDVAFGQLGLDVVYGRAHSSNVRSVAMLRGAGFEGDGCGEQAASRGEASGEGIVPADWIELCRRRPAH